MEFWLHLLYCVYGVRRCPDFPALYRAKFVLKDKVQVLIILNGNRELIHYKCT